MVGKAAVGNACVDAAGAVVSVNEKLREEPAPADEAGLLATLKPVNNGVADEETAATVEAVVVVVVADKEPNAGNEREDWVAPLEAGVEEALVVVTVENNGAADVENDSVDFVAETVELVEGALMEFDRKEG
ncbi:hypothetical protein L484_021800 [Morus notabilis]|uniref:Uncharacterized protein n=1 Tax=Morus notabilis TaxID=981085 RepID=W9QHV9_9ROSA|nr:hypothetical protein L484_021800 [Morus notabilis]